MTMASGGDCLIARNASESSSSSYSTVCPAARSKPSNAAGSFAFQWITLTRAIIEPLFSQRQDYVRWAALRTEYLLRGFSEIGCPRLKNVLHISLGIAVVEREPGALHLHHDAMPLQEGMIVSM